MTDAAAPSPASARRVLVIGGGVAGMVAALECAKVGLAVTLVERAEELGGTVRTGDVGGFAIDLGPDGYATAGGHVADLVDDLGLSSLRSPVSAAPAWVAGLPGQVDAAPLPVEAVLGIPANAWDPTVRRIIGWSGVWRAYLDRLRPPLTIGQQHNLDKLVRGRMGDLVVDRLVAPISVGRYGLTPAEIDVDAAAPGLSTALTRTGSLGGGVSQLLADPAPGFETLDGGIAQLVTALGARLEQFAVTVRTGTAVDRLEAGGDEWRAHLGADAEPIAADAVIVATDEVEARRLLAPHVPGIEPAADRTQDVVTLVVESAALDSAPRGAVVYPLPGTGDVASVAHVTARWPWLTGLGAHTHVLRVSFTAGAAIDRAIERAVAEASRLLGVALGDGDVRGARHEVFTPAPPVAQLGRKEAMAALRTAVHAVDGLALTGGWVAGSGLAQVVPDARAEAERVRKVALWGSAPPEE